MVSASPEGTAGTSNQQARAPSPARTKRREATMKIEAFLREMGGIPDDIWVQKMDRWIEDEMVDAEVASGYPIWESFWDSQHGSGDNLWKIAQIVHEKFVSEPRQAAPQDPGATSEPFTGQDPSAIQATPGNQ